MADIKKNPLSFQVDPNLFDKANDDEKKQFVTQRESVSFFKDAMRNLRKNKIAMVCIVVILIIILIAIFVPMFYPYDYATQDVKSKFLKPFEYSAFEKIAIAKGESVFPHIMGTDALGRDYCIRVIYGIRISLFVGKFADLRRLEVWLCIGSRVLG